MKMLLRCSQKGKLEGNNIVLLGLLYCIFHGGNSTFINLFDKTKFLFQSPTDTISQFFKKLEIHLFVIGILFW